MSNQNQRPAVLENVAEDNANCRRDPCRCGHGRGAHTGSGDCAAIGCSCAEYQPNFAEAELAALKGGT